MNEQTLETIIGQTLCGDLDIKIDKEGLWFYHGSPIGRKELVKLFASVLHKDEEGCHWLITPAEKGEIVVEDVAFLAVEMTVTGQGKEQSLEFFTNVDDIVIAGEDNPLRIEEDLQTGEPSPYILVRDRLEARLNRPVFYELVDLGVEEVINNERIYGVWSNGQFFQIGKITEA
ncbi:MAG: proteophosphoglycan precursor [Rhodospirillaceae bacterium]|nr:proteophosphoglycan precursor [Rhodospirillaceae bacterium]